MKLVSAFTLPQYNTPQGRRWRVLDSSAPELSAFQQRDAIESHMSQDFSGSEVIRAQGLLGL